MNLRIKQLGKQCLAYLPLVGWLIRERDKYRAERDALTAERNQLQVERESYIVAGKATEQDRSLYPYPSIHRPKIAYHDNIYRWLAGFANNPNTRILEIGSREVCSASIWKNHVPRCTYTGFDVMEGVNVNQVGDAHKLSSYFPAESFDVVVSLAVFEHLAMPWLVAEEITKVLKTGGLVCVETHFSFAEHELPWHFFQFNKRALECLFNSGLGYELVDSGMDNPMVGRFAFDACDYLKGQKIGGLYCHSSLIARKVKHALAGKDPWRSSYDEFIRDTMYPAQTGLSAAE